MRAAHTAAGHQVLNDLLHLRKHTMPGHFAVPGGLQLSAQMERCALWWRRRCGVGQQLDPGAAAAVRAAHAAVGCQALAHDTVLPLPVRVCRREPLHVGGRQPPAAAWAGGLRTCKAEGGTRLSFDWRPQQTTGRSSFTKQSSHCPHASGGASRCTSAVDSRWRQLGRVGYCKAPQVIRLRL